MEHIYLPKTCNRRNTTVTGSQALCPELFREPRALLLSLPSWPNSSTKFVFLEVLGGEVALLGQLEHVSLVPPVIDLAHHGSEEVDWAQIHFENNLEINGIKLAQILEFSTPYLQTVNNKTASFLPRRTSRWNYSANSRPPNSTQSQTIAFSSNKLVAPAFLNSDIYKGPLSSVISQYLHY